MEIKNQDPSLEKQTEISDEQAVEIIKAHLKDREWRLNNLYWIIDKFGKKRLFKLNKFQSILFKGLWYFSIVLKSRQLGITTFFCILYLDAILFNENQAAAIIAHKEKDAQKIFKKVKFAFDNLPDWLRNELEVKTDSKEELTFKNGSSYSVSTSTRSTTIQYLHISEFDYVCQKFPDKAEEIVTGAINSVEAGCIVSIESTARGSQGYFHDFYIEAMKRVADGAVLSKLQFKPFFFAWWEHDTYRDDSGVALTLETKAYFDELFIKYGIQCDDAQKRWYQLKKGTQKDKMAQEYPSTPEEAFFASSEGSYYRDEMLIMRKDKRITDVPYDPNMYVDTFWDLGMNDFNVILFVQFIAGQIRIIDEYWNNHMGLKHYRDIMKDKGYSYNINYLPHDVEVTELTSNMTRHDYLLSIGVSPIIVVPKLSIQEGIDMSRRIFPRVYIDKTKCPKLIEALEKFQKQWDDKHGIFLPTPMKSDYNHFADAFKYLAIMTGSDVSEHAIKDEISGKQQESYDKYGLFAS